MSFFNKTVLPESAACEIMFSAILTMSLRSGIQTAHPFSPTQIVLHREKEVKQTECDMAMVHHLLSRIPQDLPYELLICQAQDLFDRYPPTLLAKKAALQSHKR